MNYINMTKLMTVHEAIVFAMNYVDNLERGGSPVVWRELNIARAIVRVAIESTGAEVEIREAA